MGSPNLVSFAIEQGWYDPETDETFNIFDVYGPDDHRQARTGGYKFVSQAELEEELLAMAPVSEQEMMALVRDPRIADDEAGYGQVATLVAGTDPDLIRIWVAPTHSISAPFVPWYLGVQSVPPEFGLHRYLTRDAASTFLNPDYQGQEATDFAGRLFKQVLYYTCLKPDTYLPMVTEMFESFEAESRADFEWVEPTAALLIENGKRDLAQELLTHYSHGRAADAMALGKAMVGWLDAHNKLIGGLPQPQSSDINSRGGETVNCLVGFDPDLPPDRQNCPSSEHLAQIGA